MFIGYEDLLEQQFSLSIINFGRKISEAARNCKDTIPKIRNKYYQKKDCTVHVSPNFHIHVSVSDLNIPTIGLPILLQENMWEHINRSQTHECRNWDWCRAIPFLGIHKWDFRRSAGRARGHIFFRVSRSSF
jgi:hypothetical protein